MKYLEPAAGGGVALSKNQKLLIVAESLFARRDSKFKTFLDIEGKPMDLLDREPLAGTILEPLAGEMKRGGFAGEPAFSDVMRAYELGCNEMNLLACYCHNGEAVTGFIVARTLRLLAGEGLEPLTQDRNRFARFSNSD